jgi:hypothetical protein
MSAFLADVGARPCGCGVFDDPEVHRTSIHKTIVSLALTYSKKILAGGPLAQEVGDALIRAGCTIRILYGATEFGCPTRLFIDPAQFTPAREDWMYLALSPHTHARWVAQPGDTSGIAELQLLVHGKFVLALENLPDVQGYGTNDLFAPHPTVPGLWKLWAPCCWLVVVC